MNGTILGAVWNRNLHDVHHRYSSRKQCGQSWYLDVSGNPLDDGAGASGSDTTSVIGLESCLDYNNAGITIDGVYTLYIDGVQVSAYCDMNTDGVGGPYFMITGSANCVKT